jgi:hypothetical protein
MPYDDMLILPAPLLRPVSSIIPIDSQKPSATGRKLLGSAEGLAEWKATAEEKRKEREIGGATPGRIS